MNLNGEKIRKTGITRALLVSLCILALVFTISQVAAQGTDSARTYCVSMGYLYKTSPGINGGQPVCEFPDKSWCDAQAYYNGKCERHLSPRIYPEYAYGSDGRYVASADQLCLNSGGRLQSVHTPYGDVTLCVFPNGRTCDLQSLARGNCGGDYWRVYAQSWLDAP